MPGLDCGHAGIVVIDCDRREDRDGEAGFRALCQQHAISLAGVPTVTTPSRGKHYYFRAPIGARITNSASELADGVDVRGDGGFVVVPGAKRADGLAYVANHPEGLDGFIKAVAKLELPKIPEALLCLLLARKSEHPNFVLLPQPPHMPAAIGAAANDELSAGIKQPWELVDACHRVASAPAGRRNDTLNREAFIAALRAGSGALDLKEAEGKLQVAARQAGLHDNEIANTIRFAFQRGLTNATSQTGDSIQWECTRTGKIRRTYKNGILAVHALGIEPSRNTFSDKISLRNAYGMPGLPSDYIGPLSDNAINFLRKRVQDVIGFDPGKEYLLEAIKALAEETRHDPVKDWLGRPKVGRGSAAVQLAATHYRRARNQAVQEGRGSGRTGHGVARALFPGSKFDLCLVLEGQQGCGKSSLVRNLSAGPGEEYFVDAPGLIAMDNKTRAELITGKWVVELAELSGMARSETEGVKAFLSQASDQYRAAYAAVAGERARRCVFIATTNSQTYLPDSTGNRRFLPVPCEKIDIAAFVAERDQPFAEAYLLVKRITRKAQKSGQVRLGHALPHHLAGRFGLPPSLWREASELADDRRVVDPVEDALPDVVEDLEKWSQLQLPDGRIFVRSADLLSNLRTRLGCYIRPNGLAGWMRSLGWSKVKYGSGSKQVRGYAK